jgi:hypothetical protein
MFHGAVVVVKDVLVQLPLSCGEVRSTRAGPAAAAGAEVGVVVDPPATVVVVAPAAVVVVVALLELPLAAAVVVVVAPPPAVVSPADAVGGGSVPFVVPVALEVPVPPVSPLIHMPITTATRTADKSCHVFQDRRCLILSSPGCGMSPDPSCRVPAPSLDRVMSISRSIRPRRWQHALTGR